MTELHLAAVSIFDGRSQLGNFASAGLRTLSMSLDIEILLDDPGIAS